MNNEKNVELDTIRVKRLELVDSQGRVRVVMGIGDQEQPGLQLLRRNGSIALSLSTHVSPDVDPDEDKNNTRECSQIDFFDMEGLVRMTLQMSDEWPQYPGIGLMNSQGKEMIGLVVTPNDDAEIAILDGDGRPIWMKRNA